MGALPRRRRADRRRLASVVAATAAAVLLVGGLAAPAAQADVTVNGIVTEPDGRMQVQLPDPTALWVHVTVLDQPGGAPVGDTDAFRYDGSGWTSTDPVRLAPGTAYGEHPVTVDYRLPSGTVQHWTGGAGASQFDYVRHTSVSTTSWDRDATDLDHPSATLSGTVVAYDPATGSTAPVGAGTGVQVRWTANVGDHGVPGSAAGVTDASGAFAVPVTPGGAVTGATAVVTGADPADVPGAAVPVDDLPATASEVRIAGGPGAVRVHAGGSFTESGTAQYLTTDGWQPLVGVRVVSTSTSPDWWNYTITGLLGSGTTDAAGHFAYRVTATRTVAASTYVALSPYLSESRAPIPGTQINVPVKTTLSGLAYSLDQYGTVHVHGRLHGPCGGQHLRVEHSANGRTGWTQVATAVTDYPTGTASCPFTLTGSGYVDGYYRVAHSESDQLLAFATGGHRLHRIPTRITGFSISPGRPARNAALTASGTLSARPASAWHALGKARVGLVFQPSGDSTWYLMTTGHTSSSGRFTLHSKAYSSGKWAAFYYADGTHFYTETGDVSVRAH